MQYLFRTVGDTGMFLIRFQIDSLLWYIDSMYTKERDKDIQTQKDNQKTLIYLLFPLSAVGPGVLLGYSLWKVT